MNRRTSQQSTRGLSLIEVMIAIALLSIALITLISKVHGSMDLARVTEYQNAARELAKELMSDIEAGTVEDVLDGLTGNFGDPRGNYSELTWVIGRGDSSSVGAQMFQDSAGSRLYDKRSSDGNPFGSSDPANDPYANTNNNADDPLTRVRIVVSYPTGDPDKPGTFTLEKMLPTECVNGTRGLQDKKDKDAQAAQSEAGGGAPAGNNNQNPNNPNNSKKPGQNPGVGSTSISGGAGPK
jgi:prepilin-type N-terminal cleavage/methylation domain-containing protein